MQTLRSCRWLLGAMAMTGLSAPSGAQPVGSEFQVNTYTTSLQRTNPVGYSHIAGGGHLVSADANGNFVVVWNSLGQDGAGWGVFGQRYDSAGSPVGSEFQINSYTSDQQHFPSVAVAHDGDFVVVWARTRGEGDPAGISGQRYDSGGLAQGDEFRVSPPDAESPSYPSLASDASGNFVVVWMDLVDLYSFEIFGQRYDSEGVARGSEFQVNSYTTGLQFTPSVASDASGNFVVVWASSDQDGDGWGVFGQRYDSEGVAQGAEFRVNSYTTNNQSYTSVAAAADENFVVVWSSCCQDGSSFGVFGQRYDREGAALGSEFRVNSFTTLHQMYPSVASDAGGRFVVAWSSPSQDGSGYGVFGQRYSSAGVARGAEFQINAFTNGPQGYPSVRATGPDQFVVVWESLGQDGSSFGVFGRRFDFAGGTITVESPNTEVK